MDNKRHWSVLQFLALGIASWAWYHWLFSPHNALSASRASLLVWGAWPVLWGIAGATLTRLGFWNIVAVAVAMLLAQPSALYAVSPDIAYHIGKVMWVARGDVQIDPVMGIDSGYPFLFHYAFGLISRWSGLSPDTLLQSVSVLNLLGLWSVLYWWTKRTSGSAIAFAALWVTALALFSKDVSEIIFASPGSFALPLAVAGWFVWSKADSKRSAAIGGILLCLASLIWPTHLFSMGGVLLCAGIRGLKMVRIRVLGAITVMAVAITAWMRSGVPGGESWSGLQLVPPEFGSFITGRLADLVTLGSRSYGWAVGLASTLLFTIFLWLAWRGYRTRDSGPGVEPNGRIVIGLVVGALFAGWVMQLTSHMVRLEFVACVLVAPMAARGLLALWNSRFGHALRLLSTATLAALWLVPFLAAVSASAERNHQRHETTDAATGFLAATANAGERIWATPLTYRWVVLGRLPLFGFLAHDWPLYYGAPKATAEQIGADYTAMASAPNLDSWLQFAQKYQVRWVILRKGIEEKNAWVAGLGKRASPQFSDSYYTIYMVGDLTDSAGSSRFK